MGQLKKENQFIDDSIFKYEGKLNSQYTRVLNTKPTYTTFFHINNVLSTTDSGYQNIERFIGEDSPLRFYEVKDFPIYGLERVAFELDQREEGVNIAYESEGIILPGTLQPLVDDFFIVNSIKQPYLFKVTSIKYDTIKSNNFYGISFTLYSTDESYIDAIYKQVTERFTCNINNIGTEEKCIIRDDVNTIVEKTEVFIKRLMEDYKTIFYKGTYNSFMFNEVIEMVEFPFYDRLVNGFINTSNLYNYKLNDPVTIYLSNEDDDHTYFLEYDNSIFKALERKDIKNLEDKYLYVKIMISNIGSVFGYLHEEAVGVRMHETIGDPYIDSILIYNIKNDILTGDYINDIIVNYFNDGYETPFKLDIDDISNGFRIKYNRTYYTLVPVIAYCLRAICNEFINNPVFGQQNSKNFE